jgi:hypothetical protein
VDYQHGKFTGNLALRAITRAKHDGDTSACLSKSDDEIDETLKKTHLSMVQHAQANRAEMTRALAAVAADLLATLKPT